MDELLTRLSTAHDILKEGVHVNFQEFLKNPESGIAFEDLKDSCEQYAAFLRTLHTAILTTGLNC